MSVSFSTNRNGARCGSNFLICSTSRTSALPGASVIVVLAAADFFAVRQPGKGVYLAQPFSYRFRRNPAITLSAGDFLPRHQGGARRQPGAAADMDMVGDPDLAAQHGEILDHRA